MRLLSQLAMFLIIGFWACGAVALEVEVQGEGRADIPEKGNLLEVQGKAQAEAVHKLVAMALQKVIGPDAMKDAKVQEKYADIVSQFNTYKIKQKDSPRKEGNQYIVTTVAIIDDAKFRELVSSMGIAYNTATVRSSAIMTIMDEFFTTPTDMQTDRPLREVTVYSRDIDTNYKEKETFSDKKSSASSSALKASDTGSNSVRASSSGSLSAKNEESGSLKAKSSASGSYSGKVSASEGGVLGASASAQESAKTSGKSSVDASHKQKSSVDAKYDDRLAVDQKHDKRVDASSASSKKSSVEYGHFVDASTSDHEFFTNIKEYQPRNAGPDKQNFTVKSLQSAFQTYDIRILDNDMFKSKHFGDQPVTLEKLENSAELSRYVKAARDEARADFFSIGSSIIVDRGKSENTGAFVCDGMVAIKVYSTGDGEAIASGTLTESGSGSSPDQCRAAVADKIGSGLGTVISNKVQEYWKKRQMYGLEYIILLTGDLPRPVRSQFNAALSQVEGVTNVKQRKQEPGLVEYVLSFNGTEELSELIFAKLDASSAAATFSNYDVMKDGNTVKFYLPGN
jgi:hypothetical protein